MSSNTLPDTYRPFPGKELYLVATARAAPDSLFVNAVIALHGIDRQSDGKSSVVGMGVRVGTPSLNTGAGWSDGSLDDEIAKGFWSLVDEAALTQMAADSGLTLDRLVSDSKILHAGGIVARPDAPRHYGGIFVSSGVGFRESYQDTLSRHGVAPDFDRSQGMVRVSTSLGFDVSSFYTIDDSTNAVSTRGKLGEELTAVQGHHVVVETQADRYLVYPRKRVEPDAASADE